MYTIQCLLRYQNSSWLPTSNFLRQTPVTSLDLKEERLRMWRQIQKNCLPKYYVLKLIPFHTDKRFWYFTKLVNEQLRSFFLAILYILYVYIYNCMCCFQVFRFLKLYLINENQQKRWRRKLTLWVNRTISRHELIE